ncbi:MAG: M48 family metallopeptidase [Mariprofundaceae bacterium]
MSSYKVYDLRQRGGAAVAEMLGGQRIASSENDPAIRKLLNVIEEMAIASGMPVPPVYLLNQDGINAFAAGFSPKDAVIAVTRGATELLDRDQLQGVMAHEFSHVFNGDMRLKLNLMGVLSGITFISDTGMFLMTMPIRSAGRSSRRSNRNSNGVSLVIAVIILGFFIFVSGLIGMVIADFIKLAVSRQRKFLADAAAVQFTRNPDGIAGALKTIGGYKSAAYIHHVAANQVSHFFFGNGIKSYLKQDWWASHPPLRERIRRIDPSFRGSLKQFDEKQRRQFIMDESVVSFAEDASPQQLKTNVDDIMAQVGNPNWYHLQQAKVMLAQIPRRLHGFVADPYTARVVVYALLLDTDVKQRKVQLQVLQKSADPNVFRETLEIQPLIAKLAVELRLPLIDLVLPTLKQMSMLQYKAFIQSF